MKSSILFTAFAAVSSVTAGVIEARAALARRALPNSVQAWTNDYANVNFTTGANGVFNVNWNNPPGGNGVHGRGYNRPANDIVVNYTGTFKTSGAAYLALYGWTRNPLVEYYVIESMGNHNPSDNVSATQYGCLQSDGGTYEVWEKKRTNAASIDGDHTNFEQYWSVRTTMHTGGTITLANHIAAWKNAGLLLGTQQYLDIAVESQQGAGSAVITVGTAPSTALPNTPTPTRRTARAAGTCPRSSTTGLSSTTKVTTTTKASTTTTTVATTTTAAAVTTTTVATTPVPTTFASSTSPVSATATSSV
nr:hypothetical protein B0A51_03980 [Rachicladosporium sp. CCFEE 5018]